VESGAGVDRAPRTILAGNISPAVSSKEGCELERRLLYYVDHSAAGLR